MKRYLFVIELKPEHKKEYIEIHKNPWQELLEEIKNAGAQELLIWNYNNLSIVYYECEDIDKVYEYLGATEVTKRWNIVTGPWLADAPSLDGSDEVSTCEKIFDLNQQLGGRLEQY
ncbi:MAG: L-rhamnose mutarotase [Candidatus Humimicrobiaceae bacterium]